MNQNELDTYFELITTVLLNSAVKINKWREKFILEVLLLYLIILGWINFLQLGRYGRFGDSVTVSSSGVNLTGCLLTPPPSQFPYRQSCCDCFCPQLYQQVR